MDLNTVREVVLVRERTELPAWQPGDAFIAGGSWLLSATVFQQIASTILQTTVDRLRLRQSDTDTSKFDTGAFDRRGRRSPARCGITALALLGWATSSRRAVAQEVSPS
jgi:hypothetical protein